MEIMTKNELKIYNELTDEKSRRVFLTRKKWAETGTADFISVLDGRPVKSKMELRDKLKDKTFVCYGAGEGCRHLLNILYEFEMTENCRAIFDTDTALHDMEILGRHISAYNNLLIDTVSFIIVTPESYTISDEIYNYLIGLGVEQSKIILFSDYFALNDIALYVDKVVTDHFGENEIFVDGGCFNFASSAAVLKHCPSLKKIYAFEPNVKQIEVIKQNVNHAGFSNVSIINGALWSRNTELSFKVQDFACASHISSDESVTEKVAAYALDSVVAQSDKVTFIKLDIEGAELEALEGARMIITESKPTLAICVYHKKQDYIDIPIYIKSLVPEYKMYYRHYSSMNSETVLYCML